MTTSNQTRTYLKCLAILAALSAFQILGPSREANAQDQGPVVPRTSLAGQSSGTPTNPLFSGGALQNAQAQQNVIVRGKGRTSREFIIFCEFGFFDEGKIGFDASSLQFSEFGTPQVQPLTQVDIILWEYSESGNKKLDTYQLVSSKEGKFIFKIPEQYRHVRELIVEVSP